MNFFDLASNNMQSGADTTGEITTPGLAAESMNKYLDPYLSQVLDDTLGRMNDTFIRDNMRIGDMAEAGGSFGGSRHALLESQSFDDYMRNVGEVSNTINSQGFDKAIGNSFNDLSLRLGAAQQQHGMGLDMFNVGRAIMNDQMGMGTKQQALNQALLDSAASWLDQYISSPMSSAGTVGGIISGSPLAGNVTQTTKPGLFDYLGLGLQAIGGGK